MSNEKKTYLLAQTTHVWANSVVVVVVLRRGNVVLEVVVAIVEINGPPSRVCSEGGPFVVWVVFVVENKRPTDSCL